MPAGRAPVQLNAQESMEQTESVGTDSVATELVEPELVEQTKLAEQTEPTGQPRRSKEVTSRRLAPPNPSTVPAVRRLAPAPWCQESPRHQKVSGTDARS